MCKLDELIQEYCPDGVEYKPLGEVCEVLDNKRKPVTKASRTEGAYPYYGANGIQDYVSEYIFDGTFVLVGEDGSVITKSGTPVVTWATGKIWVNNHAHIITEKKGLNLRYLFHFIQTIDITALVHGNIPKLTGGDFKTLQIPVPPLPVQEEIVRILDTFTDLTAELTAELTARRKQYEYYRDSLLTFGDDVERKNLGEISTINRGVRVTRDMLSSECIIPVYQNALAPLGYFDKSNRTKDTTFVISAGAAGQIGYSGIDFWAADDCFTFDNNKDAISKYIFYFLQTKQSYIDSRVRRGSIPRISRDVFAKLSIPLPSLEKQKHIVAILDRFESLCNDITSGLPAEIEARQKQYEYYRDKLLTFKRKEA